MKLKIDPNVHDSKAIHCQLYVRAEDEGGVEHTVPLDRLTRESLLAYVRQYGAEKVLLHLLGHY